MGGVESPPVTLAVRLGEAASGQGDRRLCPGFLTAVPAVDSCGLGATSRREASRGQLRGEVGGEKEFSELLCHLRLGPSREVGEPCSQARLPSGSFIHPNLPEEQSTQVCFLFLILEHSLLTICTVDQLPSHV